MKALIFFLTLTLQMGHLVRDEEHPVHVVRWPQGSNTTAASASRHILHIFSSRRRFISRSTSFILSSSPSEGAGGGGGYGPGGTGAGGKGLGAPPSGGVRSVAVGGYGVGGMGYMWRYM